VPGCKGRLKDFILDWEDALPEDELTASEEAASSADLAICLGTSLQITPACDLPLRTPKAGKIVLYPEVLAQHLLLVSAHALSDEIASAADLAICLSTSLQIMPACDLPLLIPKAGKQWLHLKAIAHQLLLGTVNSLDEAVSAADLAICLGTSPQITDACDLPLCLLRQARRGSIISTLHFHHHNSSSLDSYSANSSAALEPTRR